jgi:hypothetical protein
MHKLKLEDLVVDSSFLTGGAVFHHGTVEANRQWPEGPGPSIYWRSTCYGHETCWISCARTCPNTCQESCAATCAVSCDCTAVCNGGELTSPKACPVGQT